METDGGGTAVGKQELLKHKYEQARPEFEPGAYPLARSVPVRDTRAAAGFRIKDANEVETEGGVTASRKLKKPTYRDVLLSNMLNTYSAVGDLDEQHKVSGGSDEIRDVYKMCSGNSGMEKRTLETKHSVVAAEKDTRPLNLKQMDKQRNKQHKGRDDIGNIKGVYKMCSGNSGIEKMCTLEIKHADVAAEKVMQPTNLTQMNKRHNKQHKRRGDSGNIKDVSKMHSGDSGMEMLCTPEIKHADAAAEKDLQPPNLKQMDKQHTPQIKHGDMAAEEKDMQPPTLKQIPEREWRLDERYRELMYPDLTWAQKVVSVLHVIRCRDLTEFNERVHCPLPTRFCQFNIAFFDLDKESEVKHGPLFHDIPESDYWRLDCSTNVISIKIAESDVSGTINIYGTVLARDRYDYRCVYLFKRSRDDPQPITQKDNMLSLTGPNRALAGLGSMFFEFHLKIKGKGSVNQDQVFSKGMLEHDACSGKCRPRTLWLESCLSKIDMVYTPVPFALEASLEVNILNGKSNFIGKVTAQITNDGTEIVLYDSKKAGTETKLGDGGSVKLTRSVVAVPRDGLLLLVFSFPEGGHKSKTVLLPLRNGDQQFATKLGLYMVQVKVIWKGVLRQRPNLWEDFGDIRVLR